MSKRTTEVPLWERPSIEMGDYPPYPQHPLGWDPRLDHMVPRRWFWAKDRRESWKEIHRTDAEREMPDRYWQERADAIRPYLAAGLVTIYDFRYRFGASIVMDKAPMLSLHNEFDGIYTLRKG